MNFTQPSKGRRQNCGKAQKRRVGVARNSGKLRHLLRYGSRFKVQSSRFKVQESLEPKVLKRPLIGRLRLPEIKATISYYKPVVRCSFFRKPQNRHNVPAKPGWESSRTSQKKRPLGGGKTVGETPAAAVGMTPLSRKSPSMWVFPEKSHIFMAKIPPHGHYGGA